MSAMDALVAYGYRPDSTGRMAQPGRQTQEWAPTDGGWLRFEPDGSAMPCGLLPEWMNVEGLLHTSHPQCFDFLWPDETVEAVYAQAVKERAAAKE